MRITSPISITIIFSVLLHGVVITAFVFLYNQTPLVSAAGQGIEIELISSTKVSNQSEAEVLKQQAVVQTKKVTSVKKVPESKFTPKSRNIPILTTLLTTNSADIVEVELEDSEPVHYEPLKTNLSLDNVTTEAQSTSASEQKQSILELLHSRIADNKQYPSLARRQRREGVSTISFVLHPSGMIENMYLINSSMTTALDRAALSAVKGISPFKPAQNYLKQAETFKVDVVFKLL